MISGVPVDVLRPIMGQPDRLGNHTITGYSRETVANVLVAPGATDDMEAARPEGVTVAFTLHFPKGYTSSLDGCSVELPPPWEGTYHVIGNPQPYIDANTPTPWHMAAEVERAHG